MAALYVTIPFFKSFLYLAAEISLASLPWNLLNLFCGTSSSLQFLTGARGPELSPKASDFFHSPAAFPGRWSHELPWPQMPSILCKLPNSIFNTWRMYNCFLPSPLRWLMDLLASVSKNKLLMNLHLGATSQQMAIYFLNCLGLKLWGFLISHILPFSKMYQFCLASMFRILWKSLKLHLTSTATTSVTVSIHLHLLVGWLQ